MKHRRKHITKEQQEYRDSIIKKRVYKKFIPAKMPEPEITREEYMKNCVYWLTRYAEGAIDKERAKTSVFHLKKYCDEIIKELWS